MNRSFLVILIFILASCGGTLTDEQRKKMLEASEQQAIVKVTEAEITDAAFLRGRLVLEALSTPEKAACLASVNGMKIHWLQTGTTSSAVVEQQILDAYINSVITGTPMRDNVQKVGPDSMLYTSVVVLTRPDSSIEIKGTWNIWMSNKRLILSMKK